MDERPNLNEISYAALKKYAASIDVNASGTREELVLRIKEKWSSQDSQKQEDQEDAPMESSSSVEQLIDLVAKQQAQINQLSEKISQLSEAPKSNVAARPDNVAQKHADKKESMRKQLESQKRITVMIPLEGKEKPGTMFSVILNGYPIYIPKGVYVEVPQQIADVVQESQQQTRIAEQGIVGDKSYLVGASPERAQALQ